jgi:hypothetical protein
LEEYMKRNFNRGILGLTGGLRKDGDELAPNAYYVDFSEDIWQRAWILRGEIEKSLLSFYSTLAFGLDKHTLGAVERFDLYDQRYAPFYMDASGGSRIIAMIRQTLLLEQDRVLHLLGGAPRRWLETGKEIAMLDAVTYFGKLDLKVDSHVDHGEITVELKLRKDRAERLREIELRVPHPQRRPMKAVTMNGRNWSQFNPQAEVIHLPPTEDQYRVIVRY